uniref:Uncharacterized phage-associated protein n=1 Tax=Candidatus Kentrum sp. TC TaxID=2126339 RepID=A0A450YAB1_9GAMM|nr:MAG: Uncharacterized phage-associated protein [Candidatus Kentron sp. TC]
MNKKTTEDNRANEALHALRTAVRETLLKRKRTGHYAIFAGRDGKPIRVEAENIRVRDETVRRHSSIGAQDIAEYFIKKSNEIHDLSNMKLQKMVYYAQACHLAIFGKPFFDEEIEAWMHGPVIPSLYHEYKEFGAGRIKRKRIQKNSKLSKTQMGLLDYIKREYGKYSAWQLREMTHNDAPWKEMREITGVIEKRRMMLFYRDRFSRSDVLTNPARAN